MRSYTLTLRHRNDAAIAKAKELASAHNIKAVAYKVDGKHNLPTSSPNAS